MTQEVNIYLVETEHADEHRTYVCKHTTPDCSHEILLIHVTSGRGKVQGEHGDWEATMYIRAS